MPITVVITPLITPWETEAIAVDINVPSKGMPSNVACKPLDIKDVLVEEKP